jgi:hypothetical protein
MEEGRARLRKATYLTAVRGVGNGERERESDRRKGMPFKGMPPVTFLQVGPFLIAHSATNSSVD